MSHVTNRAIVAHLHCLSSRCRPRSTAAAASLHAALAAKKRRERALCERPDNHAAAKAMVFTRCSVMRLHFLVTASALLALCVSSLAPPTAQHCDGAYRAALQRSDASTISTLELCAQHYRSEPLLRALALVHAQHPSPAAAAKVQALLALLPSDAVLLHTAAIIYARIGHQLWAALAMTRAALHEQLHVQSTGIAAGDKFVGDAARQWDLLHRDQSAHRQMAGISSCCENQEPSRACAKHFVESPKFIGM
jgi:hypothetical protein